MPSLGAVSSSTRESDRERAISVLFRTHCADLVRLASSLVRDRATAEEAVQEAFLALYRNWNGLRDRGASLAYLRSAVINRCRSQQRHFIRPRAITRWLGHEESWVPGADSDVLARDEALRLVAAIRSLPLRQREVVVCRYYLDLTEAQTAALLEIGVGSVKRHAHRALAKLHDQMEVAP